MSFDIFPDGFQVSIDITCNNIIFDISIPKRTFLESIDHIDVQTDSRIISTCFTDQPTETFESCSIFFAFQLRVDDAPVGIKMIMTTTLPTDQIDNFRNAACQVIYPFYDVQCFCERTETGRIFFLENHVVRIRFIQFAIVPHKKFQHQGLVVITIIRGNNDSLFRLISGTVFLIDGSHFSQSAILRD